MDFAVDFAVEKSSNNKFCFQCLECVNQHLWKKFSAPW